jgi:septal ring factor EnvC (AmiA/AmiB activator)
MGFISRLIKKGVVRVMSRSCCFLIALLLMIACPVSWSGQTVVGKEKELKQLQSTIKQVDSDVKNLQDERNQLLMQLRQQEKQYGKTARLAKSLKTNVVRQQSVVKVIVGKISIARKAIDRQKGELESQFKSAHAMGSKERLKVILNQQDPALSSRMLVYYDYLNKARLQKLKTVEENFRQLRQLEMEEQREADALVVLLEEQKREQTLLQNVRREREKLLAEIEKQFSSKKSQLERLKLNEKNLQQLILSLQRSNDDFPFQEGPAKPFAQLKGRLPWPVKGKLLKKFAASRSDSRWDGVLINAREGVDIHVVTRGRVVYADWLRGYGLLTIIDHGKGYMTLYAFNQSLYKAEGDWVEAGEVIASVGKSGGQSRPALYFGIRKKGKPVNPVLWCRKIRKGRVG